MSNLNKDILYLIFENLQYDLNTLYSCSMVNRLWCAIAIPILWRNPWLYHKIVSKRNLLNVIVPYLSDGMKQLITNKNIESPLFDYLSFGRSITVMAIDNILISIGSNLPHNQFLLLKREIYQLLLSKYSKVQYLNVVNTNHRFSEVYPLIELLTELVCDTIINPSYLCELGKICKSIQKIKIINKCIYFNYGIVELIKAQTNLKYFEWNDEFKEDVFREDLYEKVFSTLAKKKNVLNHLKVFFLYVYPYNYTLLFDGVLYKFDKLRSLLINCDDLHFTSEQSNKLKYPNLEILKIDYIKLNVASSVIKNSGGNIKEVILNNQDFVEWEENFSDDSLEFIRNICKYCPFIEYLSLALSTTDTHFIALENLLKVCKNLRSLLIIFQSDYMYNDTIIGDKLLDILISSKTNLKEIRFFNNFNFSTTSLKKFFEKWRGRPALSMLTCDTTYQVDDYKDFFKIYENEGVIKKFEVIFEECLYIHNY
ncbi:unnamed protein product [Rhizophagus irregularis]|nr:unnamed protein product [Rhizophagus irregularis]